MKLPWFARRAAQDAELDEEIRGHFAMAVADRIARGESPEQAVAAARREFGNVSHVKEVTREMWGGAWLDRLAQDVRYAVRSLRRTPLFTATVMLTLALGIGVTTAMFTVVRGVLLRPLPFAAPSDLYVVAHQPDRLRSIFGNTMADREYLDFVRTTRAFRTTTSYRTFPATLLGAGEPVRLPAAAVTPSFFSTLGVRPQYGHGFASRAGRAGDDAEVIVAASLWRERFGGDSSIIGRSVTIDGHRKTIVGIMPDRFAFPRRAQIWMPLAMTIDPDNSRMQVVIGRLAPGVTRTQAAAELRAFAQNEDRDTPAERREHESSAVVPLRDAIVGDVRTPLFAFSLAVGLLLLIACANASNLIVMRATARRHELGIRAALGAARVRLIRQLLTESVVISVAGGVIGFAIAFAGVRLFLAVLPPGILPTTTDIRIDPIVIAAAAVACIGAGLLSGTLPAISASGRDPREALSDAGRTTARAPFRKLFVTIETSLSLVLLVGAGLMIRSFERLRAVDLGFTPDHLVTATMDFPETQYRTADAVRGTQASIVERIGAIPGVRSAAVVNWLPLDSTYIAGDFTLANGHTLPPGYMVLKPCVSANYFGTMGIRVREGRGFAPSDVAGAERVVVISESMARTLWPSGGAVGQRLSFADKPGPGDWMRIVGVVDDVVRSGPADAPMPALYRPIAQVSQLFFISHLTFVVRTDGDPSRVIAAMRSAIHSVEPQQPIQSLATMDSHISATIAEPRFRSIVLFTFSALALLLAAVGLYGVLSYAVSERARELGIRMALGATPRAITRLMLAMTASSTIPGLVLGIVCALAGTRLLSRFLFDVRPTDPVTYGIASGVFLLAALAAAVGPARRASRIDPVATMK